MTGAHGVRGSLAKHRTKKGNQWHFGMKAHIGVDSDSGLTHTLVTTAANVSDIAWAHAAHVKIVVP
jgi:IS5 family transposase